MPEKTPDMLGLKLIAVIRTKKDGASGNFNLPEKAQALLEQGASLEARDAKGMTPLMWAAANYRRKIFDEILKRDARPHLRDNAGRNALDHAKWKKQKPAYAPLEKAIEAATAAAWDTFAATGTKAGRTVEAPARAAFRKTPPRP